MKIATDVSDDEIRGLLSCAFDGGSNYWIAGIEPADDNPIPYGDFREGGSHRPAGEFWGWRELMPLAPGCAVIVTERGDDGEPDKPHRLDRAAIEQGLALMASGYPRHFADLLSGNEDAITGDVFLQLCLFGTLVYG